jgi:carbamoylphosphate synthase large subunit
MTKPDIYIESARLQSAIESHLGIEGSLIFDFTNEGNQVKLNLITVNKRHNQSFLFHAVVANDKLDALEKMLAYARTYKEQENSYTIQWTEPQRKELHTSYFRAKNMYEALDKLYYGRDVYAITVFSIVMNPIA